MNKVRYPSRAASCLTACYILSIPNRRKIFTAHHINQQAAAMMVKIPMVNTIFCRLDSGFSTSLMTGYGLGMVSCVA